METRQLKGFVTIAERLSFSDAADELMVSQSALSQQIQILETELGVRLIDRRNRRRISLTEAGVLLLERGRNLLASEHELVQEVRSASSGSKLLRIGHMGSATSPFLAAIVRDFLADRPQRQIQMFDLAPEEQERWFERKDLDLGFAREPATRRHMSLSSLPIYEDRLVLALPANHGDYGSCSIHDYREAPLIVYNRLQAPWLSQTVEGYLYHHAIAPRISAVASGMLPLLLMVASGQGYALVPSCLRYLQITGVQLVELNEPSPPLAVSLVWREENRTPFLHEFIGYLSGQVGEIKKHFGPLRA